MKYRLMSFTSPGQFYEVDKGARTCTCPAYTPGNLCKHLNAVGVYNQRLGKLSSRPNYSQALSAVVKGIRLRRLEEAAFWLHYCWGFNDRLPGAQFRTVRRLLIGAAEDGHSIAVMEKVSEKFPNLLQKDVPFERVLAELIRICDQPNWWHPDSGGQAYIRDYLLAARQNLYRPSPLGFAADMKELVAAIQDQNPAASIGAIQRARGNDPKSGRGVAEALYRLAEQNQHEHARRVLAIFIRHAKPLAHDENFLCQAAWLLAGGYSPVLDSIEPVTLGRVRRLMEAVQLMPAHPVPEWGCDGVHCIGNDIRYAGMSDRMDAVCQQFNYYQRLDPADVWLEEAFYPLVGLHMAGAIPLDK